MFCFFCASPLLRFASSSFRFVLLHRPFASPCASPLNMPKHEEIINELEEKRVGFANNEYKTPSFHFSERWKLLLSDESSSSRLSSGRRSILLRARGLATDIVRKLGCEVLLLVLSTLDRQKLAILDKRTFVVALGDWWRAVPHPEALAIVASKCFAEHGLNRAIPSARQSLANTSSTEQDPAAAFGIFSVLL